MAEADLAAAGAGGGERARSVHKCAAVGASTLQRSSPPPRTPLTGREEDGDEVREGCVGGAEEQEHGQHVARTREREDVLCAKASRGRLQGQGVCVYMC